MELESEHMSEQMKIGFELDFTSSSDEVEPTANSIAVETRGLF